jgi:hypothetical protein
MTLRYAHLSPTHLQTAVRRLDRDSGGPTATKLPPAAAAGGGPTAYVTGIMRAGERGRTADLVLGKHTL